MTEGGGKLSMMRANDSTDLRDKHQKEEDEDGILVLDVDNESLTSERTDSAGSGKVALAKDETKVVSFFRIVLFLILAAVACSMSATAYVFTRAREEEAFEHEFFHQAEKVSLDLKVTLFEL